MIKTYHNFNFWKYLIKIKKILILNNYVIIQKNKLSIMINLEMVKFLLKEFLILMFLIFLKTMNYKNIMKK